MSFMHIDIFNILIQKTFTNKPIDPILFNIKKIQISERKILYLHLLKYLANMQIYLVDYPTPNNKLYSAKIVILMVRLINEYAPNGGTEYNNLLKYVDFRNTDNTNYQLLKYCNFIFVLSQLILND